MASFSSEVLPSLSHEVNTYYRLWCLASDELAEEINEIQADYAKLITVSQLGRVIDNLDDKIREQQVKWRCFSERMVSENANPKKADSDKQQLTKRARGLIQQLEEKIETRKIAEKADATDSRHQNRLPVKMPQIQLPTFDGQRSQWEGFWILFQDLVHDKGELTYSHKFTYLQQCLKGEAKDIIEGFVPNQEGYNNAIKLLLENYDETIIKTHQLHTALLNLKSPANNLTELKTFRLTYQKLLRSLSSITVTLNESFVKTALLNKLSSETTRKMVDKLGISFTYEQFDEHLKLLVQKMEFCKDQDREHEVRTKRNESKFSVNNTVISQGKYGGCEFCQESHAAFKCPTYVSNEQRRDRLRELRKCLRCGHSGHYARECHTKLNCYGCKGSHWGALCFGKPKTDNSGLSKPEYQARATFSPTVNAAKKRGNQAAGNRNSTVNAPDSTAKNVTTNRVTTCTLGANSHNGGVALPTALVNVHVPHKGKGRKAVRTFFDSGSQCSFIHPNLVNELNIHTTKVKEMSVVSFGGDVQKIQCSTVRLKLSMGRSGVRRVTLIVTDKVDMRLVVPGLKETAQELQSKGVKLADRFDSDVVDQVQIMIGADYFDFFITGLQRVFGVSVFTSKVGHLISGRVYASAPTVHPEVMMNNQVAVVARVTINDQGYNVPDIALSSPNPDISKLWELDTIGINVKSEMLTKNENDVLVEFANMITKSDNQYVVSLPWKRDPISLPSNYRIAKGQLHSLVTKLKEDKVKFGHYQDIMTNYLENDFIEEVHSKEISGHYLPYHGVVKNSTTTPIRLVFNASSKINDSVPSLNDMLETGPSLTEKLLDCLLMFRTKKHAVTADISKAFLRVGVNVSDRDYLRFLWIKDLDKPDEITTYKFKVVPFGSTSSPFLLQGTLYRHFQDVDSEYREMLLKSFYVDNFMTTMDDPKQLNKLYYEVSNCLSNAGMPLQMWNSNDCEFNEFISDESREIVTNVLGLVWDTENDTLNVKPVNLKSMSHVTKRQALSTVSTLYDPIGIVSPVTVVGKLIMRDIWLEKVDWDERLPNAYVERLNNLIDQYNVLHTVKVPRQSIENGDVLFIFCDASLESYGCVAYSVNSVRSQLIMSRSRVAPVSSRTIVQLELTALLLGCRMAQYILNNVHLYERVVIWSDNQCCISWLNECKVKEVYVKNRVAEARRLIEAYHMEIKYVPTDVNPADILSRGATLQLLEDSNWFKNSSAMFEMLNLENTAVKMESDSLNVLVNEVLTQEFTIPEVNTVIPIDEYSDVNRLYAVTDVILNGIRRWTHDKCKHPPANIYYLRAEQRRHYPYVYECLKNHRQDEMFVGSRKLIKDLSLEMDDNDLMRSVGRLENAECVNTAKSPVLLPPKSFLCTLLIRRAHEQCLHGGMADTLSLMRQTYWIPKGRQTVKRVIEACIRCKYYNARPFVYPSPPPLPRERVVLDRPFKYTAVDFTGAINVKNDGQDDVSKMYICMFSCLASRAVYLESIDSLSAEAFTHCLRRFIARCSVPAKLYSDNGTNFVAVNKFLVSLQNCEKVQQLLKERDICWQFNVPGAPWQGGNFERLIKVVKATLHKALHGRQVSSRELRTFLMEVEAVVNNRPLTYIPSDDVSTEILTPSKLLYGHDIQLYPHCVLDDLEYRGSDNVEVLIDYHNKFSKLFQKFKRIWENEYLLSLREKHVYNHPIPSRVPEIGDIVIVKDFSSDRSKFQLGKIVNVTPGRDGQIREVRLLKRGTVIRSSIDKLIPLELSQSNLDDHDLPSVKESNIRPRRQAAKTAELERRELIEQGLI